MEDMIAKAANRDNKAQIRLASIGDLLVGGTSRQPVTRDSDVYGYATNSDSAACVARGNTPHDIPHAASNNGRQRLVRSAQNKATRQSEAQTMMASSIPPFMCAWL